ncbi:MAG: hypothetical protein ACC630_07475 [Nitrospinota bacterium]
MEKNKYVILKSIRETKKFQALSIDCVKLYLLFLSIATGFERKELINLRIIDRAFGEYITTKKLKRMCSSLYRYGLVEVSFQDSKKDISHLKRYHHARNIEISFKLFETLKS